MDENRYTGNLPEDDILLDDILSDEEAVNAAGLTDPNELDVDQIMREILSGTPAQEPMFRDEEYTDTFGQGEDLARIFSDEPYVASEEPQPVMSEEYPAYTDNGEGWDEPTQEEEPPVRKGRPKRKKGYGLLGIPHILVTAVWLALVVMIGVSLGRVAWICVADVLAFGREEKVVEVTVEETDTIADIAQKLEKAGLIKYTQLFELYADITDAREDISAGTFALNTIYDYNALVNSMTTYSSTKEVVRVTIPEGYTCAQIFALLEENGVCSVADLEAYAAGGVLGDYWFLEGVERNTNNCLEGFLFPDTYDFYVGDSAQNVLQKLLNTFDRRFSDDLRASIDTLNQRLGDKMRANGYDDSYIADHQMDIHEIITVASLIEEETSGAVESFTISSVIYNRLTNAGAYPYLNIDAALLYAIGHREQISAEDLQTDTPYNTYLYKGLIPGPISNPGIDSISAALNPEDTSYYYYVFDPSAGEHIFSRNADEHNAAVAKVGG